MEQGNSNNNRQELVRKIVLALSSSLNPNNQVRQEAEAFIKQAEKVPGYASALLEISATPAFNEGQQIDINMAAAVQLGKIVDHHWKFKTEEQAKKISSEGFEYILLDQQDKQLVRDSIMQSLYLTTNRAIVKQYMRCITTIARYDYPDPWNNFLPQIAQFIVRGQEGDAKALITGLLGLKGLVKKYEYEMDEEREPLFSIVDQTYQVLGGIVNSAIAVEDERAYEVLYLIAKIFYLSNQLQISPYLSNNRGANLDAWIGFLKNLMDRPVPELLESPTEDMDEIEKRDKHICWKIKGVASQTTYRLFSKYGNPKFSDEKLEDFSKAFREKYAVPLLQSHLQLLLRRRERFVGSKTLNFAIKYVSQSTKMPETMSQLKPFIEQLLTQVIVAPIMLITHKDVTLFKEDPIEYVRKQNDFTETLFAPKNTAVDLLGFICKYKSTKKAKQPDYLKGFLQYCAGQLQQYTAAVQAGQTPEWRIKESILYAIGSLIEEIQPYKELRQTVEPMLTAYVFSELSNKQPFLRMRALWIYGQFVQHMKFKDQQHLNQVVGLTYQCLNSDPELPVRLTAATSMKELLKIDSACDLLKPHLAQILQAYLKLMSEIESEELVNALEEIVSLYSDDIAPFAIQLTEQLVASYQRLVQTNPEDDDGESALAAQGCVVTVRRIIDSVQKNEELIASIEAIATPMLMYSLTPDGMDSIEDALDCITMILYHGGKVSPRMWKIFPQLLYLVCGDDKDPDGGYGFEFISQIGVAVQNYISKDPDSYLQVGEGQTQTFIALTFRFIERALKINETSEHMIDGIVIMKVLIAMLENLGNGRINEALPLILKICIEQLSLDMKLPKNFVSMVVQVLCMCLWYNAQLTFQSLDQPQTFHLFNALLKALPTLKHDFELRRVIFGLGAILQVPPSGLPGAVAERLPHITKELAGLCQKMRDERVKVLKDNEQYCAEEEEKRKKQQDNEDSDDDGFVDEEVDDDEDEDDESEQALLNKISKARSAAKNAGKEIEDEIDDYDSEEDSDYEYTGGDLAIYDSALDNVDELLYVKDCLERLNAQDSLYTQQLLGVMTPEEQAAFSENMRTAQELKEREELVRTKCDEIDKMLKKI